MTNPQDDLQTQISKLLVLQQTCLVASVVHLSDVVSVSLNHVQRYELVDVEKDDQPPATTGKGKADYEARQYEPRPALFFAGSEEPVVLTDEQNEIFRPAWQLHARLTTLAHGMLGTLFPDEIAPIAEGVV